MEEEMVTLHVSNIQSAFTYSARDYRWKMLNERTLDEPGPIVIVSDGARSWEYSSWEQSARTGASRLTSHSYVISSEAAAGSDMYSETMSHHGSEDEEEDELIARKAFANGSSLPGRGSPLASFRDA